MTYAETLANMLACFPGQFLDEADALHHLFFVNGNGFRWKDGALAYPWAWEPVEDLEGERAKERAWRQGWSDSGEAETYFLLPSGEFGRQIYPLWERSIILDVPEDVQPDWLEAALKALALAYSPRMRLRLEDEEWLAVAVRRLERVSPVKGGSR